MQNMTNGVSYATSDETVHGSGLAPSMASFSSLWRPWSLALLGSLDGMGQQPSSKRSTWYVFSQLSGEPQMKTCSSDAPGSLIEFERCLSQRKVDGLPAYFFLPSHFIHYKCHMDRR